MLENKKDEKNGNRGINKFQAPKIDYEINLINACANILESSDNIDIRTLADEVAYATLTKVHEFINPGSTLPERVTKIAGDKRTTESGY